VNPDLGELRRKKGKTPDQLWYALLYKEGPSLATWGEPPPGGGKSVGKGHIRRCLLSTLIQQRKGRRGELGRYKWIETKYEI